MSTFIPAGDTYKDRTIYFEDSTTEHIPGYSCTRSTEALQGAISKVLHRMGADGVWFSRPGMFVGSPPRDGYEIGFKFGKMAGRITCAALPLRGKDTKYKRDQALKQALFLMLNQLEASLYISINKPAADSLIPYLLDSGGRTLIETLIDAGSIPMLPMPQIEK
jgi:hypothetical protein